MTQFSQKYHNYSYAPGLTTYGVDGKTGKEGLSGNSIFFTNYSLPGDFENFFKKIVDNQLPLSTETTFINRDYRNDDLFLDTTGKIYRLTNIEELFNNSANGSNLNPSKYLTLTGNIKVSEDLSDIIYTSNNRSHISKNYKGLTIYNLTSATSYSGDPNTILNLISNNDNNTGDIDFINMTVVYGNAQQANMRIYFDKDQQSYHIDSSYPILLDSNVYVNYKEDAPDGVDEYSKILTNNNSITSFYGICQQLDYVLNTSVYQYNHINNPTKYYGNIYSITLGSKDDNIETFQSIYDTSAGDFIHIQKGRFQDFQKIRPNVSTYYFKEDQEYVSPYDAKEKTIDSSNDIMISLIRNVEVYLNKKK